MRVILPACARRDRDCDGRLTKPQKHSQLSCLASEDSRNLNRLIWKSRSSWPHKELTKRGMPSNDTPKRTGVRILSRSHSWT